MCLQGRRGGVVVVVVGSLGSSLAWSCTRGRSNYQPTTSTVTATISITCLNCPGYGSHPPELCPQRASGHLSNQMLVGLARPDSNTAAHQPRLIYRHIIRWVERDSQQLLVPSGFSFLYWKLRELSMRKFFPKCIDLVSNGIFLWLE